MNEQILFTSRTHPKILFKAVVIQITLLFLHVLLIKYWPEKIEWSAWVNSWGDLILHGIIFLGELWYVVFPVLRWWNSEFVLTNKRVKSEWGVLYKQSREIGLSHIASISEERGILDRLFRCGTLNFYDAAAGSQPETGGLWNKNVNHNGVKFYDIPRVKLVRQLVEKAKYSPDSFNEQVKSNEQLH